MQRRFRLAFAVCIALLAFSSCSPAERLLVYIDPYEIEVLHGDGIQERTLKQLLSKDMNVRIEVSPLLSATDEGLNHFSEVVERVKPDWVYLSSAHPFTTAELSERYPALRFFREGPAAEAQANQIALVYDREQANHEAGRAIAALLDDSEFLQRVGLAETGAPPPRVGILVAVGNAKVEREIAAFVDGFTSLGDPHRIVRKDIGNITDRVRARRLLEGMKEEAVAVVFLKTYVLSGFCLEYLAKEGELAVVEEPLSERAYGDTVLLMLADDFFGALEGITEFIQRDSPPATGEQIVAPVRLRWNQSYRSVLTRALEGVNDQ